MAKRRMEKANQEDQPKGTPRVETIENRGVLQENASEVTKDKASAETQPNNLRELG